jgi:prophage antirepressor-like protein
MLLKMFTVQSTESELPAIQDDTGNWYFSAKETVIFAEVSDSTNATKWVKNNVPSKWYSEIKTPGKEGRPSLYLTKPGFFYAICQGKSLKAMAFRDWVFEDLLLKLEASGAYIMPNATSKQLEASKAEIESLLEKQGKLQKINKDTAYVNFKMQFIIPKLIQKMLDVEGGLVMMKRDRLPCGYWKKEKKDLFSFLRELKQEMDECLGYDLALVKTTEQLKMFLSEEKFDKLCQIVLDTSWDEYWQGYRNPEWDMSESDKV